MILRMNRVQSAPTFQSKKRVIRYQLNGRFNLKKGIHTKAELVVFGVDEGSGKRVSGVDVHVSGTVRAQEESDESNIAPSGDHRVVAGGNATSGNKRDLYLGDASIEEVLALDGKLLLADGGQVCDSEFPVKLFDKFGDIEFARESLKRVKS